ncbi:MAG: MFS transporter [Kofleriaceae bacterium]
MLSRGVAWSVALAATFTMTVSYIDRSTFAFLAPTVTGELGISEAAYGWLGSAFSIAYLVSTPLAGWWIDRVGARRGLVVSVIVWSAVAAMHALAPGFWTLFALRIALGVAEGPSFPGASQTVQRALPPADRPRGFGVLFSGSSIGGLLVPPLAGMLFAFAGWRFAFVGTAVIGLVWIPVWILLTGRRAVRAQLDAAPELGAGETRVPMFALMRHPLMLRGLIAVLSAAPPIGFMLLWGSKYLATLGVSQTGAAKYLWLPPLCLDVGAIVFGDLAARRRSKTPARGLVAIAMMLAAAIGLLPLVDDPWPATALLGVAMAGGGALYTLVTADLLARMPAASVSSAGGLLAAAPSFALIVLGPLVGEAVDHYHHYDGATIVIGLLAIPGSLVWIAWKPADRFSAR